MLKTQGSVRTLIADPSLLAKLEGLREQAFSAAEPDDFVIAQIDGSPIDPSNYTKWLSKLGRSSVFMFHPTDCATLRQR